MTKEKIVCILKNSSIGNCIKPLKKRKTYNVNVVNTTKNNEKNIVGRKNKPQYVVFIAATKWLMGLPKIFRPCYC